MREKSDKTASIMTWITDGYFFLEVNLVVVFVRNIEENDQNKIRTRVTNVDLKACSNFFLKR